MAGQAFGVIGLEVMGRNIALNIERNGFPIAVYNRTFAKTQAFLEGVAKGKQAKGAENIEDFVQLLERPRRILIMVKAGAPVDAVIAELRPILQDGDIIIDGGNSLFTDTERRAKALEGTGFPACVAVGAAAAAATLADASTASRMVDAVISRLIASVCWVRTP